MSVLVAYGSKLGGTAGLAEMVGDALRAEGFQVDVAAAGTVESVEGYDAVVIGGALYAFRWHREARRFVKRHVGTLRGCPTYLFSSGPLDDSASRNAIPPVPSVLSLMEKVGARGHATFGGRLAADVKGFPAGAMARKHAGDWRDIEHVRRWVHAIAAELRPPVAQGA